MHLKSEMGIDDSQLEVLSDISVTFIVLMFSVLFYVLYHVHVFMLIWVLSMKLNFEPNHYGEMYSI